MLTFFTIIHVLLCVFMIFVILLQPGKDAGMGAALGGGAATSAFGGRGAVTFLSKVTAVCAGLFFITSLGLSFVGVKQSVAATVEAPSPASNAPQAPGAPASDATGGQVGNEAAPAEKQGAPAAGDSAATTPAPDSAAKSPVGSAPEKKAPAPAAGKKGAAEKKGGSEKKAPTPPNQ